MPPKERVLPGLPEGRDRPSDRRLLRVEGRSFPEKPEVERVGHEAAIGVVAPEKEPGTKTYRHLALDPSGHQLVAEVSRIIVRDLGNFTDTIVGKQSDLWLFDLP